MAALAAPIALHRSLPAEEAARGDFYALLARLFLAPPDAAFLRNLASAPLIEGRGALGDAWQALVEASSAMDADAAAEEYEALFAGVGKARVSLYAGHYSGAAAIDHPRVRIQADLAALGLGRHDSVTEPEDHFAGLFEAMTGRLAAHSMFTQGSALRRLQMCADCRVVDMMSNKNEASVLKLGADS